MLHVKISNALKLSPIEDRVKNKEQKKGKQEKEQAQIKRLTKEAAKHLELDYNLLFSKSRKRELVTPRQMIFYYLFKNRFHEENIAIVVGRDRTTVLYGIEVIEALMDVYVETNLAYQDLKEFLDSKIDKV